MSSGESSFGETFLELPDLFPARSSGEPWGPETVDIDFVGGPYRFAGLSGAQAAAIGERFGELCRRVDAAKVPAPEVSVAVFRVGREEFRGIDLHGWDYTFDRDYGRQAVRLAGLDFMGRVDLEPELGGALWAAPAAPEAFVCTVENYFRVLVAYRLLALGGVLLHSAGVVSRGVAHLFLGRSGAGKSTISKISLATGRAVLSDDMNAICPDDEGTPRAEKLPFAGDLGRTPGPRGSYPIASLNRLQQGGPSVRPLPAAAMTATLLACAPIVNVDPHRYEALIANLERLVGRLRAQELHFALDAGFWELLDDAPVADAEMA